MLRVHTVSRDNLIKEAIKYNWTDYTVALIKEIASVWFYSNIAESVLLFFKEGVSGDLHSYMPIVSKYKEIVPKVKDIEVAKGKAKIIGIEPYTKTLETSYDSFRFENDDTFVTRTMARNYWYGNEVFILTKTEDIALLTRKFTKKKPTKKQVAIESFHSCDRASAKFISFKMKAWKRYSFIGTEDKKLEIKSVKKPAKLIVKKVAKKPVAKKTMKKSTKLIVKKATKKLTAKKRVAKKRNHDSF